MELLTQEQLYFDQDIVPPDFAYVTFLRGRASPLSDEQRKEVEEEVIMEFLSLQVEAGILDKCETNDATSDESEPKKERQVSPFVSDSPQRPVEIWQWEDDEETEKPAKSTNPIVPEMRMLKVDAEKKKRAYFVKTRKAGGRVNGSTRKYKQRVKQILHEESSKEKSAPLAGKEFEPSVEPIIFSPHGSDV